MRAISAILFGFVALIAAGIVATVGVSLLLALLIPLLLLVILFRIGFFLLRLVAAVMLVGLLAACFA